MNSVLACALLAACTADDGQSSMQLPTVQAGTVAPPMTPVAGQAAPAPGPSLPSAGTAAPPMQPQSDPVVPDPPTVPAGDAQWCAVKRTLDAQCTVCHNAQRVAGAPMPLLTHADLVAPAVSDPSKKVYELVGVRVHDTVRPMPPQGKLTDEQLAEIDAWVAAGAPPGADPTCAANGPAPDPGVPVWPDNCDATYTIRVSDGGAPRTVGPGAETHPQVPVQAPWGSQEVQAIAWRSITDNAKVLHHWILYGPSREFLIGWAPGKDYNEPFPDDVGLHLPSGRLTLDMHYNNVLGTQTETDDSGVEICVLQRPNFRPKTANVTMRLASARISIPPRAVNHEVTGVCTHTGSPVRLLSVSPHAHRTAHHMRFTVEKANGMRIVMHDDAFNFEEQTTFPLNPPVVVESGDRVLTTCIYTNDTDRTITFGEDTGNEMCFNFAIIEPMGGLNCGGFGLGF